MTVLPRVLPFVLAVLVALGPFAPSAVSAQVRPRRDYWPTVEWRKAGPDRMGVDREAVRLAGDVIARDLPHVTGLVVVRHGYIVHERYFGDSYGRDDPVNVRSITKSVIGTLIGIAVAEGKLKLDQTLGELIPDRIPPEADPRTREITVRHLLTMTSGWAWDIGTDYQRLIASDDWARLTLSLPVVYEPGTFYAYNTGGSHLLSIILSEVTGQDTADYAQEKLFDPLGIPRPSWQRSPQGKVSGGFGLELTPRDMAKLGELYLNEGRWDDQRIVPASYIRHAISVKSSGDSTGGAQYGYQWWVTNTDGYHAAFALGFGGQYVYIVPDLDLTVVIAAGFETPPAGFGPPRPVIENIIVPAVTPSPAAD
ncbi:MAG TPA: serine hydrolase [Thermomicrobiales bacterium]